jgi:hypothetical protein
LVPRVRVEEVPADRIFGLSRALLGRFDSISVHCAASIHCWQGMVLGHNPVPPINSYQEAAFVSHFDSFVQMHPYSADFETSVICEQFGGML